MVWLAGSPGAVIKLKYNVASCVVKRSDAVERVYTFDVARDLLRTNGVF
jgi:hypothetical protein